MLDIPYKFDIAHNSSTDVARLSVPPDRAERFLERLANLDVTNLKSVRTFAERFHDLLPIRPWCTMSRTISHDLFKQIGVASRFCTFLDRLQPALRHTWKESVPLLKEADIMLFAGGYMQEYGRLTRGAQLGFIAEVQGFTGEPHRFLMVLLYALKHVNLLRYCANPDCKEPYFVARRASQMFCSGPCAKPAQREAKRKWWNEHGEAARRKRLQKKRRGKDAKEAKA